MQSDEKSADAESRIASLEARLARIEAILTAAPQSARPAATSAASPRASEPPPHPQVRSQVAPPRQSTSPAKPASDDASAASSVLGWGGAFALVLAASYLIRLGIDSGWLTPARQLVIAAVFGLALVVAGFVLRESNRRYAGLLPAAGIAIFFMTIYGAHLHYSLISVKAAFALVVLNCALSLWLCRAFASDLYALLAVVGSYSAPLLLSKGGGSLADLGLYFSVWSVVFCVFAIWCERRAIYLLALYLALITFDLAALSQLREQWVAVMVFQAIQFGIFAVATALFSVRCASPLSKAAALAHLPPLLLFYFLEYHLLSKHMPSWAPWIAAVSFGAVAVVYAAARARLNRELPGGALLLWCYGALVLFHAGFIESVPDAWAPWVALIALPITVMATVRDGSVGARWPIWVAVGVFFAVNYLRVAFGASNDKVFAGDWLGVAYAALLYVGYWLGRSPTGAQSFGRFGAVLLCLGHLMAMVAAERLIDEPIIESGVWAIVAVGCLVLAWRGKDKLLAQTSLVVFAATALKVMLVDLRGAEPMARIIGLVVIGVTFYLGGLLYRWVVRDAAAAANTSASDTAGTVAAQTKA